MATKLRGPDYDVTSEPLDHELVMIAGEGRKHGKEAIGEGMFPRSSTRTLPEYKARLGLPKSFVCQRATPARAEMEVFYNSLSTYDFSNSYIMLDLKMQLRPHIL